jgi:hypothetical protein
MSEFPQLSMCMLTDDTYETCRRSMSYLLQQTAIDQVEMIIVGPYREQIAADEEELSRFHSYQIVEVGDVKSTGHGMAAGFMAARAPYVCYIEEHDFSPPELAEVIIREFNDKQHVALGWAMTPSNPGLVAWANIYGQFAGVVAPLESGPATRLGGHHGAYKRSMLVDYGDRLTDLLSNEAVLHADLHQRGKPMYVTGDVVVRHAQISDFPSLMRHEFIGQRLYAATRVEAMGWSVFRRMLYVVGSPLIPFVRLARSVKHVHRTGRSKELLPQMAFVILSANFAGALGEAIGYLIGAGEKTYLERMEIELDRYAFVNERDRSQGLEMSPGSHDKESCESASNFDPT